MLEFVDSSKSYVGTRGISQFCFFGPEESCFYFGPGISKSYVGTRGIPKYLAWTQKIPQILFLDLVKPQIVLEL